MTSSGHADKNKDKDKMEVDGKVIKIDDDDPTPLAIDDDEVIAEMDCFHIPLNRQQYSAATLQFLTEQPSKMEDCVARMKPGVKHLEIDYENDTDRSDGIVNNDEPVATFAGKGTSETEVLNHAMCFIEQGKAYFVEIDETFRMRRKLNSAATSEVFEETTTRRNLSPHKDLSPVRVKFARAETDAQRKRREQSSYFKHQQAEQEAWKPVTIIHQEPKFALSLASEDGETVLNGTGRIKNEPSF